VLGAISDSGGYRKRFLLLFTVVGAGSTASLSMFGEGAWLGATTLFVLASVGYYCAAIFYDSLIVDVCRPRHYGLVSTLGLGLGYVGGALLLSFHVWMLYRPEMIGLADPETATRVAFVTVGIWWLVFLVPVMLFVRENKAVMVSRGEIVKSAYRELRITFARIRQYRDIYLFLIAYWLYIGGVFTVIVMAVNFGQRLGFSDRDLVTALMITNYVGFPATILFGFMARRLGSRRSIYAGLVVYILVVCWAAFLEEVSQYYAMAITIGLVQGGVQGISRSLYAALIPTERSGEFFGFYNMVTKLAHVLGPVLIGIVAFITDEPKFILVALLPMFLIGAFMLARVSPPGSD
jgi:UMF1 family MFS transporter